MNKVVEKPKKYSLVERTPAASFEEERLHRKQRLAATFRLFSRYGFDQGLAAMSPCAIRNFPSGSGSIRCRSISARSRCRTFSSSTTMATS